MQVVLGSTTYFFHDGKEQLVSNFREPLLAWLTEEYDKKDRRDNWLLLLEIAITVLVAIEVVRGFIK